MKKSAYFSMFLFVFGYLGINSAFADNKTGLYKVECSGSHYYAHVPKDCAKKENLPLVVALHRSKGSAEGFIDDWTDVADKYKFAVITVQCEGEYWSEKSEPIIMDSVSNFKYKCNFNKKRILFTGFGGGADMAIALNLKIKRCQAVGVVGGGEIDEDLDRKELSKSKDLAIFYYCGLDDYNLDDIKKSVKRLKDAGFEKVTLETVDDEDDEEGTVCYHDDASEKIWLWFDSIGVLHRIDELKPKADKAYVEKNLVDSYFYYFSVKLLCLSIDSCEYKDNKSKVDDIVKDITEKLKKLEKIWEEKEPDAFKQVEKCLKYLEKNKSYEAAKKLMKVIEEFPDTRAEKFSKLMLNEVLSKNTDTADILAGSKPKNDLHTAEKLLTKSKRSDDDKEEAIKILEKIVSEYPYTSYARIAKDLIRKYEFS